MITSVPIGHCKRGITSYHRTRLIYKFVAIAIALTGWCARTAGAQVEHTLRVSRDSLGGIYDGIRFPTAWRYTTHDDSHYANPTFDDSDWDILDTRLQFKTEVESIWDGLGWFRFRFVIDSSLADIPLGIRLEQRGASEVYLDGKLISNTGSVSASSTEFIAKLQNLFQAVVVDGSTHVVAVRYANPKAPEFWKENSFAGFYFELIAKPNMHTDNKVQELRTYTAFMWFFVGIFGAFALLHGVLFLFYRKRIENLYIAVLLVCCALVSVFFHAYFISTDPLLLVQGQRFVQAIGVLTGLASLLFIYQVFYDERPKLFFVAVIVGVGVVAAAWFRVGGQVGVGLLFLLITCVELLRVVTIAIIRGKPGAWIIGLGMSAFALSFMFILVVESNKFDLTAPVWGEMPFLGIIILTASMSVYLSRGIAQTNQDLQRQVIRVRQLSEEQTRKEVEQKVLEAQYAQKLNELEEARQLQLSMLPSDLPELPDCEVAVHMQTATEVGGDYYDFFVSDDAQLTIAVGDATGHGMKAGTMVTATKSLFSAFAGQGDLLSFFRSTSVALKRMKLRQLYMALTVARLVDRRLQLVTAGMPLTLVWRSATSTLDTVQLKGMPLGSFPNFPYTDETLLLNPGDTVLFMSDGFPELFNPKKEMLGYEEASRFFAEVANQSASEIIRDLVQKVEKWTEGRPLDDDVTFVVLKML